MGSLVLNTDFSFLNNANTLSLKTKDVYKANQGISIKMIEDKNMVVKTIHVYVNQAIMDKGINMPPDEINYLLLRIVDDIMKDFSGLSLDDIKLAFYYGVRGEFGDYYGINTVTLYNWLKSYINELLPSVYKEVVPLLPKHNIVQEEKVDYKLVESEMAITICRVYWQLCINGTYEFNDLGNIHYKFLDRNGLISVSEDDLDLLQNRAKERVMNRMITTNIQKENQGKSFHKLKLSEVLQQIENGDENNSFYNLVEVEKMKLIFHHVLYNFAVEEIDLYELIKHKIVS